MAGQFPKKPSRFNAVPAVVPAEKDPSIRYQRQQAISLNTLFKQQWAVLRAAFKSGNVFAFDLKTVNLVLKGVVVLMSVYFAVSLVGSLFHVSKPQSMQVNVSTSNEARPSKISSFLKEATYYLEKARARDIFTMGVRQVPMAGGLFSRGPSPRVVEATQNYKLVGISWSSDPDVMIEDTKNQRTFFLKEGQVLENEVRLERVYKDKVVLGFAGEEIELQWR